ncbi:hypothetical protein JCM9279_000777 [Rhodotorula babjevae]
MAPSDVEHALDASPPPARPPAPSRRRPSTTAHIDTLLDKWRAAVAARFAPSAPSQQNDEPPPPVLDKDAAIPVFRSVFTERDDQEKASPRLELMTLDHREPMTHDTFEGLVEQVRLAIEAGVQPRLNSKGSSGSYFARNAVGRTLGIFKPADEEPYGTLNPKLSKWIHRNFLAPIIPFGRACLLPGQSYLSEAAASIVDDALATHIVPRTEVAELASPAFFYDWVDLERERRKDGKLRAKEGSFQVFLDGFVDASAFLARLPFPGRLVAPSSTEQSRTTQPRRRRHRRGCCTTALLCLCGRSGAERDEVEQAREDEREGEGADGQGPSGARPTADGLAEQPKPARSMRVGGAAASAAFAWTVEMVESFREELEKLVVLDFLIRNTDRGLDNFMLRPCTVPCSSSSPPKPHLHLAAIDNSLAFPHKHPSGWRTYTYGWLYLPLSLIGEPWSAAARAHFVPLLADPEWWSALKVRLRREFRRDRAFSDEMWERQWSVVKGQGVVLLESLRSEDEGPVELARRPKKLVIDEHRLVPSPADPPPPSPNLRRLDSEPRLPAPVESRVTLERPSLPERRSAPADTLPQIVADDDRPRAPAPSSPTVQAPIVVRHARHRRSRSDMAAGPASSSLTAALGLSASFDGAADSAHFLRRPLDALATSAGHRSSYHTAGPSGAPDGEETGVALLSRLDRVEATEARRLKRARRDRAARAALDETDGAAALSDGEGAAGHGGRRAPALSGRAQTTRASRSGRRASASGKEVDETTRMLGGAIDEEDEDEDGEGEADGRIVMSWFGGQGRQARRDEEERVGHASTVTARPLQWVVFERVEDVKETRRTWPWR